MSPRRLRLTVTSPRGARSRYRRPTTLQATVSIATDDDDARSRATLTQCAVTRGYGARITSAYQAIYACRLSQFEGLRGRTSVTAPVCQCRAGIRATLRSTSFDLSGSKIIGAYQAKVNGDAQTRGRVGQGQELVYSDWS